ncbi:hypothetical protein [Clostridium cadaveris]|uniref:hypothetical protein n=1 Tax=Clostridium cadaveris TaxID=1529 RepID=UPI0031E36483
MVRITKINWLSKEALEAEVTVSDGRFELVCFSQPFNYALNDTVKTSLYCYAVSNVIREQNDEFKVEKLYESFAYILTGKLINKKDSVVEIGDVIVEIEKSDLPGDIEEGNYISFNCKRIDIY